MPSALPDLPPPAASPPPRPSEKARNASDEKDAASFSDLVAENEPAKKDEGEAAPQAGKKPNCERGDVGLALAAIGQALTAQQQQPPSPTENADAAKPAVVAGQPAAPRAADLIAKAAGKDAAAGLTAAPDAAGEDVAAPQGGAPAEKPDAPPEAPAAAKAVGAAKEQTQAAAAFDAALKAANAPQPPAADPAITAPAPPPQQSLHAAAADKGAVPHSAPVPTSATPPPAAAQAIAHVVHRAQQGASRFEIRLDPPELGSVDVSLRIGDDQRVHAHFAVEKPDALDQLTRNTRDLERALSQAGLDVASGGLSFELKRDRGGPNGGERTPAVRGRGSFDEPTEEVAAPRRAAPLGLERWRGVRVDLVA